MNFPTLSARSIDHSDGYNRFQQNEMKKILLKNCWHNNCSFFAVRAKFAFVFLLAMLSIVFTVYYYGESYPSLPYGAGRV